MPIDYRIHRTLRLVEARGHGAFTDANIFGYQREVWSRPEVAGFNELIDARDIEYLEVPTEARLREFVALAASMDPPDMPSRVAVVATDRLAIGIAQMYGARRDFVPSSTKEVRVFTTRDQACEWLEIQEAALSGEWVRGE